MTDTEKILTYLDINSNIPSIVIDDEGLIVASNEKWAEKINRAEPGASFYKVFDKSTRQLIKNTILDSKTFDKVQRKKISFETEESIISKKIIVSPFKLDSRKYYFIFLFNENLKNEVFLYPTIDKHSLDVKYSHIFKQLEGAIPSTLIERKNLQFNLDSEKESIAVGDRNQILYFNITFENTYNISSGYKQKADFEDVFSGEYSEKINLAANEAILTKNIFVVEKIEFDPDKIIDGSKIIISPLVDNSGSVFCTLYIGKLQYFKPENESEQKSVQESVYGEKRSVQQTYDIDAAKVIYDKNNYDILDVNTAALSFYGYDLETFKNMNMTQLFPPEDMQKLLDLPDKHKKEIGNRILSDGRIVEVQIEKDIIDWQGKSAVLETLSINEVEEEVIPIEEFTENKIPDKEIEQKDHTGFIESSEFLSGLFHELLTPVNVILGFVQEIIDSIENPTEEQEESAKIIKDNQQILLQTMNSSVQYAQLIEGKIKVSPGKFDINNCIVDLQDTFLQIGEKNNTEILFYDIPDSILLDHDRSKLLAAINYLVKFSAQISKSSKIYISFESAEENLYVKLKDNEEGISSQLLSGLNGIFHKERDYHRNDYGVSPIAIKLADVLYKILKINVLEYTELNNVKTFALAVPLYFRREEAGKSAPVSDFKDTSAKYEDSDIEEQNILRDALPEEDLMEIQDDNSTSIKNGEVDDKIVEDIEEEEEIFTEEIATLENDLGNETDLSNYSCLFIDDNFDTQLLFKTQMKDFKLLKVCSNLTEALPLLKKYSFDLIIVDVNLNDKYNGFDALKIIRQFENYASTPVIAVTAYSFKGDKQKFLDFGFTDYFVKPLLRKNIIKALQVIL